MDQKFLFTPPSPSSLVIYGYSPEEVLRIDPEGRIFWKGCEVESDADFRAAMLEVHDALTGVRR